MVATLGKRLRKARLAAGFTASAVADQIGRRKLTIYRWEWGTTTPAIEQVRALARLYRCSFAWLVSGDEAPPEDESLPPCA